MKIILSGGGTAGHINPAVAIAKYILSKEPDSKILFIGTKKGLESTLVPKEGFDIKFIDVEGFSTGSKLKNIIPGAKFVRAVFKCKKYISDFKPDMVIGTGGYVCAPVVYAANSKNIPTLIHEQNVFPGAAIKFLASKSTVTAISFDESRKYFKNAGEILLTGNPIRPKILSSDKNISREKLNIGNKKLVVAVGGSLGATAINNVMCDFIKKSSYEDIKLILSTGKRDYESVRSSLKDIKSQIDYEIREYIDDMDTVLAAADLVICRSGAITLSEIAALGKASILIPSPNVVNNHQEYNARAFEKAGAACVILENELNCDILSENILSIISSDSKRQTMEKGAYTLSKTTATEEIYSKIKSFM